MTFYTLYLICKVSFVTEKAHPPACDSRALNRHARLPDEQETPPGRMRLERAVTRIVPALLLALAVAGCNIEINSCGGGEICINRGGERIVGSGSVRTEARAVEPFTAVRLEGAGRV